MRKKRAQTRSPNRTFRRLHRWSAALDLQRTVGERVADGFAAVVGSWTFIIVQSVLLAVWVIVNLIAWQHRWDPYPFILLNLVLSFQAAYASPIIMMSQNRQSRIADRRNQLDLQINLLAEQESTETLRLLRKLCEHSGIDPGADPHFDALLGATRPDELARVKSIERWAGRPTRIHRRIQPHRRGSRTTRRRRPPNVSRFVGSRFRRAKELLIRQQVCHPVCFAFGKSFDGAHPSFDRSPRTRSAKLAGPMADPQDPLIPVSLAGGDRDRESQADNRPNRESHKCGSVAQRAPSAGELDKILANPPNPNSQGREQTGKSAN